MENIQKHLPEDWHEAIFQEKIKPVIFKNIETASTPPMAIISGGQPGSGKTKMLDSVAQEFKELSATARIIGEISVVIIPSTNLIYSKIKNIRA
jgi:Cdc6-like AAA superfamily ATPase